MVQPSRTPFVMSLAGASRGAGIQRQATRSAVLGLSLVAILLVNPRWAAAHCDTLDGPVVKDARLALETGETLVRVHRAGEGAPLTGLKPTGTPVEPGVAASDNALETGSPDVLVALVTQQVEAGIRERFGRAKAARSRSGQDVEAGRTFVAAYVDLVHYAERVLAASGPADEEAANRLPPAHEP